MPEHKSVQHRQLPQLRLALRLLAVGEPVLICQSRGSGLVASFSRPTGSFTRWVAATCKLVVPSSLIPSSMIRSATVGLPRQRLIQIPSWATPSAPWLTTVERTTSIAWAARSPPPRPRLVVSCVMILYQTLSLPLLLTGRLGIRALRRVA